MLVVSDTILEVIGHQPASDIDVFEEYLFTSPTDHAIRLVLEILFIFNMQIDLNILFLRNIFFVIIVSYFTMAYSKNMLYRSVK